MLLATYCARSQLCLLLLCGCLYSYCKTTVELLYEATVYSYLLCYCTATCKATVPLLYATCKATVQLSYCAATASLPRLLCADVVCDVQTFWSGCDDQGSRHHLPSTHTNIILHACQRASNWRHRGWLTAVQQQRRLLAQPLLHRRIMLPPAGGRGHQRRAGSQPSTHQTNHYLNHLDPAWSRSFILLFGCCRRTV